MSSLVEKNVSNMTDKLFGDKDETLKELVKMDLLGKLDEGVIEDLKRVNEEEKEYIDKEMTMTLDEKGEIIPVNK